MLNPVADCKIRDYTSRIFNCRLCFYFVIFHLIILILDLELSFKSQNLILIFGINWIIGNNVSDIHFKFSFK